MKNLIHKLEKLSDKIMEKIADKVIFYLLIFCYLAFAILFWKGELTKQDLILSIYTISLLILCDFVYKLYWRLKSKEKDFKGFFVILGMCAGYYFFFSHLFEFFPIIDGVLRVLIILFAFMYPIIRIIFAKENVKDSSMKYAFQNFTYILGVFIGAVLFLVNCLISLCIHGTILGINYLIHLT